MSRWHNIYLDNFAYFFTATVAGYTPLLSSDSVKTLVFDCWNFYRREYHTNINAYVIMPEHLHLIIRSDSGENIRKFIQHSLRKISMKIMNNFRSPLEDRSCCTRTKEKPNLFKNHTRGKAVHRFWKERAKGEPIFSDTVMKQKLDYIHMNPVKRGLVENPLDYLYSSYRNYHLNDQSTFQIDSVDILLL